MKLDWQNNSHWNYKQDGSKTWHVEHVLQFVDGKALGLNEVKELVNKIIAETKTEKCPWAFRIVDEKSIINEKQYDVNVDYNEHLHCFFLRVYDVMKMEKINEILGQVV